MTSFGPDKSFDSDVVCDVVTMGSLNTVLLGLITNPGVSMSLGPSHESFDTVLNRPEPSQWPPDASQRLFQCAAEASERSQRASERINTAADNPPEVVSRWFRREGLREFREASNRAWPPFNELSPVGVIVGEPKTVEEPPKTIREISRERLGPQATEDDLNFFAWRVAYLHKLDPDTELAPGTELKLPGQRADGGIYFDQNDVEWRDGSRFIRTADGITEMTYRKDGAFVQVTIDEVMPERSKRIIMKGDIKTEEAVGRTTVSERKRGADAALEARGIDPATNPHARLNDEQWTKKTVTTVNSKGAKIVEHYVPDKAEASKIHITYADGRVVEAELVTAKANEKPSGGVGCSHYRVTRDSSCRLVDPDARLSVDLEPFTERVRFDLVTGRKAIFKTNSFGVKSVLDENTRFLMRSVVPGPLGQTYTRIYGDDQKLNKVVINRRVGPPLELLPSRNGEFSGQWLGKLGKPIGTVKMDSQGMFHYRTTNGKRSVTECDDGRRSETIERLGVRTEVTSSAAGKVTTTHSRGHKVRERWEYPDGKKLTMTAVKGRDQIDIQESTGARTTLTLDVNGLYKGQRVNARGMATDSVIYSPGKDMIFTDKRSGSATVWRIDKPEPEKSFGPPAITVGKYNPMLAQVTINGVTESAAPGRTERYDRGTGTIRGATDTGITSEVSRDGQARVENPDGSGALLNRRAGTVTVWDGGLDENKRTIPISETVKTMLNKHPEIDGRDVAEIYRQFRERPLLIDSIFNQLSNIKDAKNLTEPEKNALRRTLLHHIAYDAELSQGQSPTCGLSTIQRGHIHYNPSHYVETVVRAISEGTVKLPNGKTVRVADEPATLKRLDVSGRDPATRIYHNAAASLLYYSETRGFTKKFEPTEDGIGRYRNVGARFGERPLQFSGLLNSETAELHYRMTGEQKTIVIVNYVADMAAVLKTNKSVTAAVNANDIPIEKSPVLGSPVAAHGVTVTKVDLGDSPRIHFSNNWGPKHNRSADARVFLDNMKSLYKYRIDGQTGGQGQLIANGDRTKVHRIQDGVLVVDQDATARLDKERSQFK